MIGGREGGGKEGRRGDKEEKMGQQKIG